jgi:2-dehydro-3-deoxyphosphogluconate aldolase/(4S)-4-hydroxy-2-oxoglutarate aldolase
MSWQRADAATETVFDRIRASRLVPVVRVADESAALPLVQRLLHAGLDVVEVTTTITGWDEVVRSIRTEYPRVCVGAGTVTDAQLARRAVDAGAGFCVSPCLAPQAREALAVTGVPLIEGGLTPTEVLEAARHGVAKLVPAHVGGVRYLQSLLAVAPWARIMPTGGIPLTEARAWLHAGAFAVGVGADLAAPGDVAARLREVLGP